MSYSDLILANANLLAYYPLSETSGTTATDAKGTTNLTYSGGVTLNQPGIPAGGVCPDFASASSGMASGSLSASFSQFSSTAEIWFKRRNTTNTARQDIFFIGENVSGGKGFGVVISNSALIVRTCGYGDVGTGSSITDTNWHHIVITWTSSGFNTFNFYLDGVLAKSNGFTSIDAGATHTYIGSGGNGNEYVDGKIAHLAIYSTQLDATTIGNHYSAGTTVAGVASVSATTSLSLAASVSATRDLVAVASTQFGLAPAVRTQFAYVSATSSFSFSDEGSAITIGDKAVSAASMVVVSTSAIGINPHDYAVSASTSFTVSADRVGVGGPRVVSAATRFSLFASCGDYVSPILVSASSGFRIKGVSSSVSIGDKPVSASSVVNVSVSQSYSRLAVYSLFASSGIALSGNTAFATDRPVSASSGFSMDSAARQARDLFVSATTGLGLTIAPGSNQFYQIAASNSVLLVTTAGILVTGTVAESRFILVDRAQAVLWLPWRRGNLGLSPGGNLPHS